MLQKPFDFRAPRTGLKVAAGLFALAAGIAQAQSIECESDSECESGSYCILAVSPHECRPPQAEGAACKRDVVCASGKCDIPEGTDVGVCTAPECSADGDCEAGSFCILALTPHECRPPQPAGAACKRDVVCASGKCDIPEGTDVGVCTAPECSADGDCELGSYCILALTPHECRPPQAAGAACKRDVVCASGKCDIPEGSDVGVCAEPQCNADSDCEAGSFCILALTPHECRPPQPAGAACKRDVVCASGKCDIPEGTDVGVCAAPECSADTDCELGSYCILAVTPHECRLPQEAGAPCKRDVVCASGKCDIPEGSEAGTCASSAEPSEP